MSEKLRLDYSNELGLYRSRDGVLLEKDAFNVWNPGIWTATLVTVTLDEILRFWTGTPDLEFEGETYLASRVINVNPFASNSDTESGGNALSITLSAIQTEQRQAFLTPVGPVPIRLQALATENAGKEWRKIGQEIVGVMSNQVLAGSNFTFQVEPRTALTDRARIETWSHEDRVRKYGVVDQGMSQMPKLAEEGVLGQWPNP